MAHSQFQNIVDGALAGTAATIPMSAVMLAADHPWLSGDPYPLPPRQITLEAAEIVGVRQKMDESTRSGLTIANHFGYGAAMGALFGAICGDKRSRIVIKGMGFGLGVWAGSYWGWLPAIDSGAAASQQSARRNAMMMAAHLVWGASLGYFMGRHQASVPDQRESAAPKSATPCSHERS